MTTRRGFSSGGRAAGGVAGLGVGHGSPVGDDDRVAFERGPTAPVDLRDRRDAALGGVARLLRARAADHAGDPGVDVERDPDRYGVRTAVAAQRDQGGEVALGPEGAERVRRGHEGAGDGGRLACGDAGADAHLGVPTGRGRRAREARPRAGDGPGRRGPRGRRARAQTHGHRRPDAPDARAASTACACSRGRGPAAPRVRRDLVAGPSRWATRWCARRGRPLRAGTPTSCTPTTGSSPTRHRAGGASPAPLVSTLHATEAGRHAGWISQPSTGRCTRWSGGWPPGRHIVTCSPAMRAEVAELFELDPARIAVMHNGIDATWNVRESGPRAAPRRPRRTAPGLSAGSSTRRACRTSSPRSPGSGGHPGTRLARRGHRLRARMARGTGRGAPGTAEGRFLGRLDRRRAGRHARRGRRGGAAQPLRAVRHRRAGGRRGGRAAGGVDGGRAG